MLSSLTGIHFLITYGCSAQCDHCFLWGAPHRTASMRPDDVDTFLDQAVALGTITGVCAEGGESFTRYDIVMHFLRAATARGFNASALTNASWVTSREQTAKRIAELQAAGLTALGISTDEWHRQVVPVERVDLLLEVCTAAGLSANRMETALGGVMFRGRAAEKLAHLAPGRPAAELTKCPHEQLAAPARVHLDCYAKLHLCQGLCVGAGSITEACANYDAETHPIVSRLMQGGPYALAQFAAERGYAIQDTYADACHLCYRTREYLRPQFPDLLGPDEMYGE